MASLHRIQWIDECIRHKAYPSINKIVERFEISRRQALRDIEYLRDSLGAPVEYSAKHKGYFYSDDSFSVPTQLMTANQRELLACLSSHYDGLALHNSRTSDVFKRIAELLTRLSGTTIRIINEQSILRDGVVPFHTVLQAEGRRRDNYIPDSLKPYYRGKNDMQQEIYEFYDSHDFIPAILASGLSYRIIHPHWLKNKLIRYLEHIRQVNIG